MPSTKALLLRALAPVLLATLATMAPAQKTGSFEIDTPNDFMKGDITTSTLTWNGLLQPPLKRELLAPIDAEVVWDIAERDDRRYIATGHEGKLLVEHDGEVEVLHKFDAASVYAIYESPSLGLLAAPSPGGRVYTVGEDSVELLAETGAGIIWDMIDFEGGIALATGPKGKIFTLDDSGTTATLVQFPDTLNVLDLMVAPEGEGLIAATQGPGRIARVAADGSWRVLLDTEHEEVRRVASLGDGSLLAAVNAVRSPGERLLQSAGEGGRAAGNSKPRPESFIARIHPDGFAEEWWTSPEAPIHDLHVTGDDKVLVTVGERGLLLEITSTGDTNVRGVTDQKFLTRLARAADGTLLAGTGGEAALLRLDPGAHSPGLYESQVFDGLATVRWTRLRGMLASTEGTLNVSVRTGNTAEPDDSWSEWSEPVPFPSLSEEGAGEYLIPDAVSRFLQFQLVMEAGDGGVPAVDLLRLFHSRPNAAPVVRELNVQFGAGQGSSAQRQASARPQASRESTSGGGSGSGSSSGPNDIQVQWSAEDPDGDDLRFNVYLRPADSRHWILFEENLESTRTSLRVREIPDGEYRLRVVASDHPSNPPDLARTGERESSVFAIDTTPPVLAVREVNRTAPGEVTIRVTAEDRVTLIQSARWRLAMEDWNIVFPDDGAFDSRSETFTFTVTGDGVDQPGYFVTFSATDQAGNTAVTRIDLD